MKKRYSTNPRINTLLKKESTPGILLFIAAALAILCANSFVSPYYDLLLSMPVEVRVGNLEIAKPLLLWINDGLMAVFFFIVGLELKRELLEGELSDKKNIVLPAVGAFGGMVVPALVYVFFNYDNPEAIKGWAIPAATDIAFALGVLTLLGDRVPVSVKVFLTSLAVFDDVGAIIIIALFYTSKVSLTALIVALICLPILYRMNRKGIADISPYLLVGLVVWVAMLKSGVHATLAGVVIAMFIPNTTKRHNGTYSPLKSLEHDLHPLVSFIILPVFAFANAGLELRGLTATQMLDSVPMGIALGLFVGKQLGIFSFCWLFVKLKLVTLPKDMNALTLYGVSIICGIGFTMSLFISALAFEDLGVSVAFNERLGIIIGSLVSGIVGYLVLKYSLSRQAKQ